MDKNEKPTIELSSLVGSHLLSGFERTSEEHTIYGHIENIEIVRFVLDGVAYEAAEDPSDGYRSEMDYIGPYSGAVLPFAPVAVVCRHRTKGEHYGQDDVLEVIHAVTGETILEIGTSNIDDYYPSWVANWSPERAGLIT